MVHTVSLGVHNGLHGIRVYVDDNKLLAKVRLILIICKDLVENLNFLLF